MGDSLAHLDATAQAALIEAGEISPGECIEAAIDRIERLNPTLNAVIAQRFEAGRDAARSPDLPTGPFRGVPILTKDLGAELAGMPSYAGNRARKNADYRAPDDTRLGKRLRATGAIDLGRTNVPEFGIVSDTQPLAFGATRNPWDLERSVSGSSGGSAAAVAAGLVPLAHASDSGGSIRTPAAWCGLVGLKPSRGRISSYAQNIDSAMAEFAVARSVRDVAGLLDAIHGGELGDLFGVAQPGRPYLEELGRSADRLRVGLLTRAPGVSVDPECVAGVEAVAKLLDALGHEVEEAWPEALFEEAMPAPQGLWETGFRRNLGALEKILNRPVTEEDVEPFFWRAATRDAPPVSVEDYLAHQTWVQGWAARVAGWWGTGFDLLITPTVCRPPVTLAELLPPEDRPWYMPPLVFSFAAFTMPFTTTGQPAISLPLHWTAEGLPVGIQLVAASGREDLLLRTAATLENASPWKQRVPPVCA